jgi:sporulation protein YlmC with PRC-barrel domain
MAMLRSLKALDGYRVAATDGELGSVVNFLFDDERWTLRYLVVKTGHFFDERKVLISPISFSGVDWSTDLFHLALTMDKIKKSPGVDTDQPVSRQHERDYYRYYGYPYYWGYSGAWAMGAYPGWLAAGGWDETPRGETSGQASNDAHLRSANEVRGYHIQGSDDAIGKVSDFIVDDETWEIRYLAIDTSHWGLGKRVLVAPRWANRVSWDQRKVYVDLSRQAIKNSPEWDGNTLITREYEARMHEYYGRPPYWGSDDRSEGPKPPQREGIASSR